MIPVGPQANTGQAGKEPARREGRSYHRGVVATRERSKTSHRRGRDRRIWPWIVLAALGVLVAVGVLALIPALSAKTELQTGRSELVQARELLLADPRGGESVWELW